MLSPVGMLCRTQAAERTEIKFADVGWDSIKLSNALAGLVAEEVFGFDWTEIPGSTPITHEALIKCEVDVVMEEWTDNIPAYGDDLAEGKFREMGINFNDNYQGFYIPRYVADEYPDLKSVEDLKDYAYLFPDPDDSSKSVIYGGIPGWGITEIMGKKVEAYSLSKQYNYMIPGSNAALDSTISAAWDAKKPIVTYYWEPTWLMGKYDFVLLEDSPYDPATYSDGIGACPAVTVTVAVSNDFYDENPEYCEFLSNFSTSSPLISEALAYMQESGESHAGAARWLLKEHPELIDEWLTEEQGETLSKALSGESEKEKESFIWGFPFALDINTAAIDTAVRGFAVSAAPVLTAVQTALNLLVNAFNSVLNLVPWFVLIAAVFLVSWRIRKSVRTGLLYAALLFLVGVVGLWEDMKITLAIVLASVVMALLIGLPIGIAISGSESASRIMRPVLDTMQTMPVFVYLIPALLLFGMGNASSVIATVIYAVVPVIRLTSLGIRQVDKEVVEAAKSFGSTKWQLLFKVQIPQALPTIMTGVNQTLMMAMSMVVTCSMIGARGLGMEVLNAVNRIEIGRGLIAGSCVVIIAVLLDRLTQGKFSNDGKEARGNRK